MPERPPFHPPSPIAAIMIVWLILVFLSLGVAIPALVNMQNDGALILAILLGGLTVTSPIFVWPIVMAIWKERTDED